MNETIAGYGVNTQNATGSPEALERTIRRLGEYGCTHAEISLSRAFAIAGGSPIPSQVKRLVRSCRAGGLEYTVHAPLRINFYDTEHLALQEQVVRASIDITGELGGSLLNVHCGYAPPETFSAQRESLLAREREVLARLAEYAGRAGVVLAVENTFPETITGDVPDLPTLATQIRTVDSPHLCGCLDVSHASIMSAATGRALLPDVAEFSSVVGHLHLNDCFATPRPAVLMPPSDYLAFGWGDLHLPLGWGGIDWSSVADVMTITRPTVVILEVGEPFWDAALSESLQLARAFAERAASA